MLSALDDDQEFRTLARPGQPRQYVVLSGRSARSRRVRHVDRDANHRRAATRFNDDHAAERRSADAREPALLAAHARRSDRRTGDRQQQRSRSGIQARRQRLVVLLPARLLLDGKARRKIPFDHRSRETSWRACPRAPRLSRGHARGSGDVCARNWCGQIGRDAGGRRRGCRHSCGRGRDCAAVRLRT